MISPLQIRYDHDKNGTVTAQNHLEAARRHPDLLRPDSLNQNVYRRLE